MLGVSQRFHANIKLAAEGMYRHPFFGSAKTEDGCQKRLQGIVRNKLLSFADQMRERGHPLDIVESEFEGVLGKIFCAAYAKKVEALMFRMR